MRRTWTRIAVSLAALVVVALLAVNVVGGAAIPVGPLGNHQATVLTSANDTIDYRTERVPLYLTAIVENAGPVSATVVRVTPIGVLIPGSVEILGSLPFNSDDPSEHGPDGMDQVMLGVQPDAGARWASPEPVTDVTVEPKGSPQHQGRAFLVRVTPDPTRETGVYGFDVEYTIGPLHFITSAWGPVATSLLFCGQARPVAGEDGCVER